MKSFDVTIQYGCVNVAVSVLLPASVCVLIWMTAAPLAQIEVVECYK